MFIFYMMIIIFGVFLHRMFIISILLCFEGIFLVLSLFIICYNLFFWSITSFSMILITLAVLEGILGLSILLLIVRFFFSSEISILLLK